MSGIHFADARTPCRALDLRKLLGGLPLPLGLCVSCNRLAEATRQTQDRRPLSRTCTAIRRDFLYLSLGKKMSLFDATSHRVARYIRPYTGPADRIHLFANQIKLFFTNLFS